MIKKQFQNHVLTYMLQYHNQIIAVTSKLEELISAHPKILSGTKKPKSNIRFLDSSVSIINIFFGYFHYYALVFKCITKQCGEEPLIISSELDNNKGILSGHTVSILSACLYSCCFSLLGINRKKRNHD